MLNVNSSIFMSNVREIMVFPLSLSLTVKIRNFFPDCQVYLRITLHKSIVTFATTQSFVHEMNDSPLLIL